MRYESKVGFIYETPKKDVLEMEPHAFIRTAYEPRGRMFYVCLDTRTLAVGTSARHTWARALEVLKSERILRLEEPCSSLTTKTKVIAC